MERVVVVNLKCVFYVNAVDQLVAARCAELGLSAYGNTKEEATSNFKQLFNRCIHGYREKGKLADVLERSGLDWWWENEYPQDCPDYENTNHSVPLRTEAVYVDAWQALVEEEPERALAVAA